MRDLDYTQVDERLAIMLNAVLQLEAQGTQGKSRGRQEAQESETEAVLMVGYTSNGISNPEQTTINVPVTTSGRVIPRSHWHEKGARKGPEGTGQGQSGLGPSGS